MKKFIVLTICLVATTTVAVQAYEYNQYGCAKTPCDQTTKTYDKNGCLQNCYKPQPDCKVKTYNKFNQCNECYKKPCSKAKYGPKDKGQY